MVALRMDLPAKPLRPRPIADAALVEISIVIPVWNESGELWANCRRWVEFPGVKEIILAVAGPPSPASDLHPRIRVVACAQANRGAQQKLGAAAASGDVLLFHHADSDLRAEHIASLCAALREPSIMSGAFVRAFDERHPRLKWLQRLAAWQQERWGALYGDQSIFVRRGHYEAIGGYPPLPLMEDVAFSRRLRRSGRIALLQPPLATSARRHSKQGSWRTSLRNGALLGLYRIGVSPFRLHRWYYRELQSRSILALIWRELICRRKPTTRPDSAAPF
jgi:rSAM/selenodomain-associated transferase 2